MATSGVINKRTDNQSDRDKSYEEDYKMRLHEFTNRKDYIPSDTESADPSKSIKTTRRDKTADDAGHRVKEMLESRNMS